MSRLTAQIVNTLPEQNGVSPNGVEPAQDFAHVTSLFLAPESPVRIWPSALADFFRAAALTVDAPVDMVATFAAPIIGAVIGNRRALTVKRGFVVRPIVWSVVIA